MENYQKSLFQTLPLWQFHAVTIELLTTTRGGRKATRQTETSGSHCRRQRVCKHAFSSIKLSICHLYNIHLLQIKIAGSGNSLRIGISICPSYILPINLGAKRCQVGPPRSYPFNYCSFIKIGYQRCCVSVWMITVKLSNLNICRGERESMTLTNFYIQHFNPHKVLGVKILDLNTHKYHTRSMNA